MAVDSSKEEEEENELSRMEGVGVSASRARDKGLRSWEGLVEGRPFNGEHTENRGVAGGWVDHDMRHLP